MSVYNAMKSKVCTCHVHGCAVVYEPFMRSRAIESIWN